MSNALEGGQSEQMGQAAIECAERPRHCSLQNKKPTSLDWRVIKPQGLD
jgi:hypothetical protein